MNDDFSFEFFPALLDVDIVVVFYAVDIFAYGVYIFVFVDPVVVILLVKFLVSTLFSGHVRFDLRTRKRVNMILHSRVHRKYETRGFLTILSHFQRRKYAQQQLH